MTVRTYVITLLSFLSIIPAGILYFLPMKNQIKLKGLRAAFMRILLPQLAAIPLTAYFTCRFSLHPNTLFFPMLIIFFLLYHLCLTVHISVSLAIFMQVCALMSIFSNFANGFDALVNPYSGCNTFSMENSLFQLALSGLFLLVFAYPVQKFGSYLVDSLNMPHIWYTTLLISGLLIGINLLIRPLQYQTHYTNKVFLAFWGSLCFMLASLLILTILFYFIVNGILREAKTIERNRILEMQESYYTSQQKYIKETARIRHDFKHTLHALENLAKEGNLLAIRQYLADYLAVYPQNDNIRFCDNPVVNALLNYYLHSAGSAGITLNHQISLPGDILVSDIDLCNILGNILENAILACEGIPEPERFINLSILPETDGRLYIVLTNSFNGIVKKKNGHYLSTNKKGNGIGIFSIISTVEKYGGSVRFSHEGHEFYTDVVLPLSK